MIRFILACILCVGAGVSGALAEELTIAAASDLNFAMKDLVAEYEKTSGQHVKLSLGSSGNFYSQNLTVTGAVYSLTYAGSNSLYTFTYSVTSGSLPNGLSLSSTSSTG